MEGVCDFTLGGWDIMCFVWHDYMSSQEMSYVCSLNFGLFKLLKVFVN